MLSNMSSFFPVNLELALDVFHWLLCAVTSRIKNKKIHPSISAISNFLELFNVQELFFYFSHLLQRN